LVTKTINLKRLIVYSTVKHSVQLQAKFELFTG
jgi:hypothetical protein